MRLLLHKICNRRLFTQSIDSGEPIYLRISSSDASVYNQVFCEGAYTFSTHTEPSLIVDAGANIGLATRCMNASFPQAQFVCIEPDSGNFQMLQRNLPKSRRITNLHCALWNNSEQLAVIDSGFGNWGFRTESISAPTMGKQTIGTVTIHDIIREYGHISILKIDIEGAEIEALSEVESWQEHCDSIIVEFHPSIRSETSALIENLKDYYPYQQEVGENVFASKVEGFFIW